MKIIDVGTGPAIVIIPGVQGRWEWIRPAVEALARNCRVITFSLADEPGFGGNFDERRGFTAYIDQVRQAMDECAVESAAICGVSYGGLIAAGFAARHPARTDSLVLVSALPPSWTPDARVSFYLRAPALLSPLFCLASLRMYREIAAAAEAPFTGMRAALAHGWNVVTHMFSPARMARRVKMLSSVELEREVVAIDCPVLIVTGEPQLDRVVPVARTREYLKLLPQARIVTIERTGHLGLITRPEAFAEAVAPFAAAHAGRTLSGPHVGRTLSGPPRRRVG
jgi:pimeloyl-ACP methyl ester carboxylesterase